MYAIQFSELNFAGYETKREIEVESYRTTKNLNGSYNIICTTDNGKLIFNNCSYPKRKDVD